MSTNNSPSDQEMTEKKKKKKRKPWKYEFLLRFGIKITVIALIVFAVLYWGFGITVNYGNASFPAVRDGDLVIYSKWNANNPELSQMVLYDHDGERWFGRVIAATQEEVDITEQGILLDGNILAENLPYETPSESCEVNLPLKLESDEIFVLNDYRVDNHDSRMYGAIKKESVKGIVCLVIRWRGF